MIAEPANPPTAEVPEKASVKIWAKAEGSSPLFAMRMKMTEST